MSNMLLYALAEPPFRFVRTLACEPRIIREYQKAGVPLVEALHHFHWDNLAAGRSVVKKLLPFTKFRRCMRHQIDAVKRVKGANKDMKTFLAISKLRTTQANHQLKPYGKVQKNIGIAWLDANRKNKKSMCRFGRFSHT